MNDAQYARLREEVGRNVARAFDSLGMEDFLNIVAEEASRRSEHWEDQARQVQTAVDDARLAVFGGRR